MVSGGCLIRDGVWLILGGGRFAVVVGLGCGGGGSAGSTFSHNKLRLDLFSGNHFCYSEFTFAFLDCYIEGMIRWRDWTSSRFMSYKMGLGKF